MTLTVFSAKKTDSGNSALLEWSTTKETTSEKFEIQHSEDGKNWVLLTISPSQCESKELVTYNYTHVTIDW
ncbi:hypothetical protein [Dyadobacter luteus]|uniref:hypothetical protein n=1 Tax=Dyadobacter luteus TaxID=2259619 RepID=UPI0011C042DD|nr:hypothetical protein [Dyadobacter luteus]